MTQPNDPLAPLTRLDLNQLVALEVLLRLRSVTHAATQLGVTQSAMSHTLRRLRATFDDPLLVRGGSSMMPTPRASALVTPLRVALRSLADAIAEPAVFDPATTERSFRLTSPDLFDVLAFPALLRRFSESAPRASLTARPGFDRLGDRLETGDIDVAVVPQASGPSDVEMGPPLPGDLRCRWLLDDTWAPFVREGHPVLAAGRLSPEAFAALDHILVSPTGEGLGMTDAVLAEHGVARRIVYRAPTFSSAVGVAQHTDLVVVAPASLAAAAPRLGLVGVEVAFALPGHKLNLVWHPRFDADPAHRWFRDQLQSSVEALR